MSWSLTWARRGWRPTWVRRTSPGCATGWRRSGGLYRLGVTIQHVRSVFKHAFEAGLIPTPIRFGPGFNRPTKKAIRLHRAQQGPKLFSPDEVHRLLDAAGVQLRAMILLGINAGFGNGDCGNLPLSAVNLDTGWLDYPRPKTGINRRCPLWPETLAALREALVQRPAPKEAAAGLFFVTRCGMPWSKDTEGGPITKETRSPSHTSYIAGTPKPQSPRKCRTTSGQAWRSRVTR
jgi:integrase